MGWNRLELTGIGWSMLEYAGICLNMLQYALIGRNRLKKDGIGWSRLSLAVLGWNRFEKGEMCGIRGLGDNNYVEKVSYSEKKQLVSCGFCMFIQT